MSVSCDMEAPTGKLGLGGWLSRISQPSLGVGGAETGQWEELSQAWSSDSSQPPLSLAVGRASLQVWAAYLSLEGFITILKTNQRVLSASSSLLSRFYVLGYWVLRPINKYTTRSIRSPELSSQLRHCDLV